ncbi:MAG: hypothetical protein AB7N90_14700, partial [Vicinamibacterales bacterium]
ELASARLEHEWRAREVRSREHELAALAARLRSLEELDAHRAGFGDAARMVLAQANGEIGVLGALADALEVEPSYERAVEACLGELLQHVIVRDGGRAAAGLDLVRREDAGRCGFVVLAGDAAAPAPLDAPAGCVPLTSVVRVGGEHAAVLREVIGEALIAESFETAARVAPLVAVPVATLDGDVFRGAHLVAGGGKSDARGILETKREIKDLGEKLAAGRASLDRLVSETAGFEQAIAQATAAIAGLSDELHRQEKSIVGVEGQVERASADEQRLAQRTALVTSESRRAEEQIAALDERHAEARESLARLEEERGEAEERLGECQRALLSARDHAESRSQAAAEARAAHAGLVERAAAATAEVGRLEDAARELVRRVETCTRDLAQMREQRERLLAAAEEGQRLMDEDVEALEGLRRDMIGADEHAASLRAGTDRQDVVIRDARRALDAVRALVSQLDVTRATAESDLAHLAQQCVDAVAATLDDVRAEVEAMEAAGDVEPDARRIRAVEAAEPDEDDEDGEPIEAAGAGGDGADDAAAAGDEPAAEEAAPIRMTAEEAIAELRAKIEKLGPVNMMAIEQFDELEERHAFLTTQRQDLIDSIAQTNEAIRRIDETTHARFREAFAAINQNFQSTFTTLFGGGRAGITLLDENDPLESGIDIVASPPGKRLQSVQLLSGGEKALTAIALMFAIFRHKPSPFCVLDEIDAPLDDANIGRFVEMLRGMLDQTQFIIITHSRKTMEIANRLYGVTMEEPGVSKLISIQLN